MAERNYRCKEGKIAIFLRRVEMLSFQPVATLSQRLNKKKIIKKIQKKKLSITQTTSTQIKIATVG